MTAEGIPSLQEVRNFSSQYRFSERETEVFMSLVDKFTTAEAIGLRLGVSPNTVSNHFKNILRKTGTPNKSALLSMYLIHIIKQLRHCKMFERRPRVLVVDDEPDICEILKEDLESRGVIVHAYSDPRQALEAVRELKLDFVISDIRMPNVDGVNFLSGLRQHHRYHPLLIFMTGYAQYGKDELMHMGAVECFEKPVDPDRVFVTLMQHFIEPVFEAPPPPKRGAAQVVAPTETLRFDKLAEHHLGFGGVFIPVDAERLSREERFLPGSQFDFQVDFLNSGTLKARGEVVWSRTENAGEKPAGMGVRFVSLKPDDRKRVEELVRQNRIQSFIPMGVPVC